MRQTGLEAFAVLHPQLAAEKRRSAGLVEDLRRTKEENFLAVRKAIACAFKHAFLVVHACRYQVCTCIVFVGASAAAK